MTRPTVRTDPVDNAVTEPIKSLFGTVQNAQRLLGLRDTLPWSEFRRALSGEPVRPEHADAINDAWRAWCRQWVLGVTRGRTELTFLRTTDEQEERMLDRYYGR